MAVRGNNGEQSQITVSATVKCGGRDYAIPSHEARSHCRVGYGGHRGVIDSGHGPDAGTTATWQFPIKASRREEFAARQDT